MEYQKEHPVHKDTDLFPAFFNFIEFYLNLPDSLEEVKRYLIVGLSKLLFANKKEIIKEENFQYEEFEDTKKTCDKLKSQLDFLFARFHLANDNKNYDEAISKLSNSIIMYSEIYGPESIGLTPNYYYLANYFAEKPLEDYETQDTRDVIIRNIYNKIANIWKFFFLGEVNEMFESKFSLNNK